MEKLIIYGAGETGHKIFEEYSMPPRSLMYNVLCLADSDPDLWDSSAEIKVISPDDIHKYDYDMIIIGIYSKSARAEVYKMLTQKYLIPEEKLSVSDAENMDKNRELFCMYQAQIIRDKNITGCVAEAGVFRGEFAKYINAYFPDRKFYLFDTFAGHDEQDKALDEAMGIPNMLGSYLDTSVETVRSVLPYPERAVFCVGYFPETAKNIDEQFAFVSLDMNLYTPTRSALDWFYPRMSHGGIILCHDYLSWQVEPGVHIAIDEFCSEINIPFTVIGDRSSVVILKQ